MPPIDISRSLAIDGWMSEEELLWLAAQAQRHDIIIEVGAFLGRSTLALAHTGGVVIAVDSWDVGWPIMIEGQDSLAAEMARRHPHPMIEFAENVRDLPNVLIRVGTLRTLMLPFSPNMVFLDGDHAVSAVRADIDAALTALAPYGGLLCGHDYQRTSWPGVTEAVQEYFGDSVQSMESIWWVEV